MIINMAGGNGVMGKVHIPVLEKAGNKVIISGRHSSPSLEEAAKNSDLTIVSVPIDATQHVIKKVGPYCRALMDFTSVKMMPIEWMLKYTNKDCEVVGLHPLYGDVDTIKDKSIIACFTERPSDKCYGVLENFKTAGANIRGMDAEQHDMIVNGKLQSNRIKLFQAFILSLEDSGLNIKDIYQLSPPPTKILLDLIARQADESNDDLYEHMREFNSFEEDLSLDLKECLNEAVDEYSPERIRKIFGKELPIAQERAKKLIASNDLKLYSLRYGPTFRVLKDTESK